MRAEAKHARIRPLQEYPIVCSLQAESVQQIQLHSAAEPEVALGLREAGARHLNNVHAGSDPWLDGKRRVRNRERHSHTHRETELVDLFIGQKAGLGLGVPDAALQSDGKWGERST